MKKPVRLILSATAILIATLPGAAAEWPVASLPEIYREMPGSDQNQDAATSGSGTLVVWQNAYSAYAENHSVHATLLHGESASRPFTVRRSGVTPRVAANESGWLIAYGIARSRFNVEPYTNVAVRAVAPNGVLGPEIGINDSAGFPRVESVEWSSDHWMIAFSDGEATVAFLNSDLTERNPPLELGSGGAPQLRKINGRWWAFYSANEAVIAAEILEDGTEGRRHAINGRTTVHIATNHGQTTALLTSIDPITAASQVSIADFDPASGFSTPRPLFDGRVRDLTAIAGELFVVHVENESAPTTVSISRIAPDGTVETVATLDEGGYFGDVRLRHGSDGNYLLVSALNGGSYPEDLGLYLVPLEPGFSRSIDWSRAVLLSVDLATGQGSPFIVSTGNEALVFWNELSSSGTMETWSRRVDPSGAPVGEPTRLPYPVGREVTAAWAEDRVVLAWTQGSLIYSAAVRPSGEPAGEPSAVGRGSSPALAARGGVVFLVWETSDRVRGTPLRKDASPHVPEGFEILPSYTEPQRGPAIAAVHDGFLLLWLQNGVESVVISDHGTPRSSSRINRPATEPPVLAASERSALAAWNERPDSTLYAFGGAIPFEPFPLHDQSRWLPVRVDEIGPDRYLLVYSAGGLLFSREIRMDGAFITGISAARLLSRHPLTHSQVAVVSGQAVAVWVRGHHIYAGTAELRQRRGIRR